MGDDAGQEERQRGTKDKIEKNKENKEKENMTGERAGFSDRSSAVTMREERRTTKSRREKDRALVLGFTSLSFLHIFFFLPHHSWVSKAVSVASQPASPN